MSRVAIIPARAGSKRIPGKNIRHFHGKPVIAYSIETALASGLFDAVMVSTDSDEIAGIAQRYGATFWRRPAELADDKTGTQAVMREALIGMGEAGQGLACCIYATAPLMTVEDLKVGLRALEATTWSPTYAFSVTTYDFPVDRALLRFEGGGITELYPERGERPAPINIYHDAGQWYWGRSSAFIRDEPIYSPASIGVPIPRYRAQDINTPEDWRVAELMYAALNNGGSK